MALSYYNGKFNLKQPKKVTYNCYLWFSFRWMDLESKVCHCHAKLCNEKVHCVHLNIWINNQRTKDPEMLPVRNKVNNRIIETKDKFTLMVIFCLYLDLFLNLSVVLYLISTLYEPAACITHILFSLKMGLKKIKRDWRNNYILI